MKKELKIFENEIETISKNEDREILQNNEKINKIHEKLSDFLNYDLELNLLIMKIGIKDEIKDNLSQTIQDSYLIDVEFMTIQGGNKFN